MALKDLFFSIFAKDETATGFGSVKNGMKGVEGAAATMTQRIDRSAKSLVKLAGMGSAVSAGLAMAFRGASAAYDNQIKAEQRVERAIRATGGAAGFTADQLARTAKQLQDVSGFGDQDILSDVTAQLLDFQNIAGDVFRDANRLAVDLAAGMRSDLKSAAADLGSALSDPVKGMDSLTAAGIRFTAGQRATIQALQASGNIAGAQRVILDQVAAAYDGQAAAMRNGADGAKRAWQSMWTDVQEVVGRVLNDVLPPAFNALSKLARLFMDLSPPVQRAVVILGGLAVALPPVIAGIGALTIAVNALMGPVGLVIGGIAALTTAAALLWPQTDRVTDASNDLVTALGDEITQSQMLQAAMNNGVAMSVNMARQKLEEARARYENVKAVIAEQRVLAQSGPAFIKLEEDLLRAGIAVAEAENLNDQHPTRGMLIDRANMHRDRLIEQREQMVSTSQDLLDQLNRERENVAQLEAGLDRATGAMVQFGDAVVEPIEPTQRLDRALGGGGASGGGGAGLTGALNSVGAAAEAATVDLDDFQQAPVWDSIRQNMRALLDGSQSWGDTWRRIVGDALDRIFDLAFSPAWDRLFDNLQQSSLFGGGGGGLNLGGLLGGVGKAASNLLGFDTGGAFTVRGRAGTDRNVAAVRLSEGERVEVLRRGEGAGGRPVNVYIQTPDPAAFAASRAQVGRQIAAAVAMADRAA